MPLSHGSKLGPYVVDREIGRGGMGIVYLARDHRLERSVAIKALPEHLAADPARLSRFEMEARSLAQLNHRNVAGIYGVEEQEGSKYLVLEYVEGDTLADRLAAGALPVDDALEIAVEIAAGVEAAHQAGVIHRDLKPDNIKLAPNGVVKVLDFGLAKTSETLTSQTPLPDSKTQSTPARLTMPGAVMGTAAYMSPEQARGRSVDKRADIWSFGVILYEMLVGASPFVGETVNDSIGAVLYKGVDLALLPPTTPATIRLLLRRCLMRDPKQRLHDIADARLELEAAIADPQSASSLFPNGLPRASRKRGPILIGALIAIAMLAGGLALGWMLRQPPAPAEPQVARLSLPLPWRRELVEQFDFSPDGTTLAFTVLDPDAAPKAWSVHIRRLDADKFEKIYTSTRRPQLLWFSPDGADLILIQADEENRQHTIRLPVDGGRPVPLLESAPDSYFGGARCWLSDDEFLVSSGWNKKSALYAISARDGSVRTLIEAPADLPDGKLVSPTVVPGGTHLLATHVKISQDKVAFDIYSFNLGDGAIQRIVEGFASNGYLHTGVLLYGNGINLYASRFDTKACATVGNVLNVKDDVGTFHHSDTGHVAYFQRREPGATIATIDRAGTVESVISARRSYIGLVAPSPDGGRVAVTYLDQVSNDQMTLAVIESATGATQRVSAGIIDSPRWTSDGNLLYCQLDAVDGTGVLSASFMKWNPHAQSPPVPLRSNLNLARPNFSATPSGAHLIFVSGEDLNEDLMLIDLADSDSAPEPYLATSAIESDPALSPDGQWLAYTSKASGTTQVYVTPFNPGDPPKPVRVSIQGGENPTWSRDGKELFFYESGPLGFTFMSATVQTSPELVVSPPVKLFHADQYDNNELSPTSDGNRFIFIDAPERRPDDDHLIVVLNWAEELKRELK